MARRNWMFGVMRKAFERYGFQPIETPAMESLQTLTGKYGEEGDQLIFKILNNGDYLGKANADALAAGDSKALTSSISKKLLLGFMFLASYSWMRPLALGPSCLQTRNFKFISPLICNSFE